MEFFGLWGPEMTDDDVIAEIRRLYGLWVTDELSSEGFLLQLDDLLGADFDPAAGSESGEPTG
jgi:hypothetical protein